MKKVAVFDGNSFSTISGFYDEVERKLTNGLTWEMGRNLDAFNDVLRGGFGVHEYEEPILIIWSNWDKSKTDLGFDQTISYLQSQLSSCHSSNVPSVTRELNLAKQGKCQTLADLILEIIQDHKHVELVLR